MNRINSFKQLISDLTQWSLALAMLLVFITPSVLYAQTAVCLKEVTSAPNIDGIVAAGVASGGACLTGGSCTSDTLWEGVSPSEFHDASSSPKAKLHSAYNGTTNELYIGVTVGGDDELSDFDYVLLYFDADNNDTWNIGDFALQIKVSNANGSTGYPVIQSGTQCCNDTGGVTYWKYDNVNMDPPPFGRPWQVVDGPESSVTAKMAYDYTSTTGDDLEDEIWNLEISLPTNSPNFMLNTLAPDFFAMGGYVFIDNGHQSSQVGQVRAWPPAIHNTAIAVNQKDPVAVDAAVSASDFPDAADLGQANIDDICYDVNFSVSNPWAINGNASSESGDEHVNRGDNDFSVTFKYDGPSGATPPLPNEGIVELAMKPYGNLPSGVTSSSLVCKRQRSVTATNLNGTEVVDFSVDLRTCDGWPNLSQLSFLCVDLILKDFERDDNISNNRENINGNKFATSEYNQTIYLSAESVPNLSPGEETTIVLKTVTQNDISSSVANGSNNGGFVLPLSFGDSTFWQQFLAAALILMLLLILIYYLLPTRRKVLIPLSLGLSIILVTACSLIDEIPSEPGPNERWEFANAEELGIRPLDGETGWYSVPIRAGELLELDLSFTGMPLPYQMERSALIPVENNERSMLTYSVRPGQVITLFGFGRIDLDGEEGPLNPTTANGMVYQDPSGGDGMRGLLLRDGYYQPNAYLGALVGSFDGFDQTSFPVGRNLSLIVPDGASTLTLASNVPTGSLSTAEGAFEIGFIEHPPIRVPTFGTLEGDATFEIPHTFPSYEVLTTFSLYSYYEVENLENGELSSRTRHPIGFSHYSIYDVHL